MPENELYNKVQSKVYNALADIASELFDESIPAKEQEKMFDLAYEWFTTHFFE